VEQEVELLVHQEAPLAMLPAVAVEHQVQVEQEVTELVLMVQQVAQNKGVMVVMVVIMMLARVQCLTVA
jgi:hypothetical protein